MNKLKYFILLTFFLILSLPIKALNINEVIKDDNLATCITSALNKQSNASITTKELETITVLSCSNKKVSSLEGIDKLKKLEHLDLSHNNIKDVVLLGYLDLVSVNLSYNDNPSNINQLYYSRRLKELSLDGTNSNLLILSDFKQIEKLSIANNKLSDISFVDNLPNLKELNIAGNNLKDINILSDNNNLNILDASYNNISKVSSLAKNVTTLNVAHNKITDLLNLKSYNKLHYLDVSYNQLSNINFLMDSRISSLDISSNKITNIDVLNTLKDLKVATLDYSMIKDTSKLNENVLSIYQKNDRLKNIPKDTITDVKQDDKDFNQYLPLVVGGVILIVVVVLIIVFVKRRSNKTDEIEKYKNNEDVKVDLVDLIAVEKEIDEHQKNDLNKTIISSIGSKRARKRIRSTKMQFFSNRKRPTANN
jgi:Leucine-rich repeat (LRR) protein